MRLDRWLDTSVTYPEVGATMQSPPSRPTLGELPSGPTLGELPSGPTLGDLPGGYRHVRRSAVLGSGTEAFAAASQAVLSWQMHCGAGLRVWATSPTAVEGAVVVSRLGIGPARFVAPCRVVYVIDEEHAHGFGYGTLPGHPATGEEAVVVRHEPDDQVTLSIVAFSRPARWYSRLGGPVARRAQDMVTSRYLRAVREIISR